MKIGVIIGRFQVPELHKGHLDLFEQVNNLSDNIVILVGTTVAKNTQRDPLDYATRELMLQNEFLTADIHPLADQKTNEYWSETIDNLLLGLYPNDDIILYGMRDSFIPSYMGILPVIELTAKEPGHNATEIRKLVSQKPIDHPAFRKACMYQSVNRYPISYQAVDLAILDLPNDRILLGRREHELLWRFPGGIVDPLDESLESAALREGSEEVVGITTGGIHYTSSRRVSDYRYKDREDQIMTAFFRTYYIDGTPVAGDDLFEVKWFSMADFIAMYKSSRMKTILVSEHIFLMEDLLKTIIKEQHIAA